MTASGADVLIHIGHGGSNVIARIPGAEEPDKLVILGNHHDAWVNGAGDPVSG